MFGKKNGEKKMVKMIQKDYECRQCHKVMCKIYVKPEDEEAFDDSYPVCWSCFLKLCEEASANSKKKGAKK